MIVYCPLELHPAERRPAEGCPAEGRPAKDRPARGSSSSAVASLLSKTEFPVDGDSVNSNEVEERDEAKELETGQEVEAVKEV